MKALENLCDLRENMKFSIWFWLNGFWRNLIWNCRRWEHVVDLGVDDFVMYQWITEEMTSIWCGQYMVWIWSIRGRLWDCNILAGSLEGEDCYLLRTLHGVDEVPAYVIQLIRLTNLITLRFMGSNSQRHSVASLNTGIIWLRRSENLRNPEVTGHSKRARRQTCVIFQWSENLHFVFWTLRLRV